MIPKISPSFFPANNPTKRINRTNKLGCTPAIVNQVKKLACKKYNIKKDRISIRMANIFFKVMYHPLCFYASLVITNTVLSFVKSTAVSTMAYLSVILLVLTTSLIVPI